MTSIPLPSQVLSVAIGQALPGLVGLITLPVVIRNLSVPDFGLYSVVTASAVLVGFVDLGSANMLVTAVPKALATGDVELARAAVRHALRVTTSVGAALLAAAVLLAFAPISWSRFTSVLPGQDRAASHAVAVLAGCIALTALGSVFTRIEQSRGRSGLALTVQGAGASFGIGMTAVAAQTGASVPVLVFLTLGPGALARISLAVTCRDFLFGPRRAPEDRRVFGLQSSFFAAMQISALISYYLDQLVIATFSDLHQVGDYALVSKATGVVVLGIGAFSTVLWPYLSGAVTHRRVDEISRVMRNGIRFQLSLVVTTGLILLVAHDQLWELLSDGKIRPGAGLMTGFVAVLALRSIDSVTTGLLNAIPVIRFQLRTAALNTAANLALSIVLVRRYGAAGATWGTALTQLPIVTLPYLFRCQRELRDMPTGRAR